MRWLCEGEWSGYTSSQRGVVHRVIVRRRYDAAALMKIHGVQFTDNTFLSITVRELKPRDRVAREIHGYDDLLREAVRIDTVGTYVVRPVPVEEPQAPAALAAAEGGSHG